MIKDLNQKISKFMSTRLGLIAILVLFVSILLEHPPMTIDAKMRKRDFNSKVEVMIRRDFNQGGVIDTLRKLRTCTDSLHKANEKDLKLLTRQQQYLQEIQNQ